MGQWERLVLFPEAESEADDDLGILAQQRLQTYVFHLFCGLVVTDWSERKQMIEFFCRFLEHRRLRQYPYLFQK